MSRSRRERTRWRPMTRWRHALPPGSYDSPQGESPLLRYVGLEIDPDSRHEQGVFQIAAQVLRTDALAKEDRIRLISDLRWFSENLRTPRRFSHHRDGWRRSASGIWLRKPIALSWFKHDATVHLRRIARIIECLRRCDRTINTLQTRKPGYVTYEDQFQVVAVPFSAQENIQDEW
jgi:hypothetical protein